MMHRTLTILGDCPNLPPDGPGFFDCRPGFFLPTIRPQRRKKVKRCRQSFVYLINQQVMTNTHVVQQAVQRFVSQRPLAHTWTCEPGAPIVKTKHIIYLALIAISVVVALYYLPVREPLLAAAEWARLNPFVAAPLYLLVYIAALILMIPAWTLMLAGGYLFGTTAGMGIVVLANLAGSIATFILGRTIARRWVLRRARRAPRFRSLDRAFRRNGFLMITMARLALVPYNLLNYASGLTAVRLRDYAAGTVIGTLPLILLNVVVGSKATDISALVRGDTTTGEYDQTLLVLSLVGIGGAVFVITRIASRTFKSHLQAEV